MRGGETACPYLGIVDLVLVQDLVAQLLVDVGKGRGAVKGDAARLLSLEVNLQGNGVYCRGKWGTTRRWLALSSTAPRQGMLRGA